MKTESPGLVSVEKTTVIACSAPVQIKICCASTASPDRATRRGPGGTMPFEASSRLVTH